MAWLSSTGWAAADKPVLATVLNNIGLDLRTWGGNVDAGANCLTNLGGLYLNSGAYFHAQTGSGHIAQFGAENMLVRSEPLGGIVTPDTHGGAMYFGSGGNFDSVSQITAGIEASWGNESNPQIGIGVLREGLKANIVLTYVGATTIRNGSTNLVSIAADGDMTVAGDVILPHALTIGGASNGVSVSGGDANTVELALVGASCGREIRMGACGSSHPWGGGFYLYDATASALRLFIDASGRIGNTASMTAPLHITGLPVYADNAAALAGGLTAGAFYRTSTGAVQVVY